MKTFIQKHLLHDTSWSMLNVYALIFSLFFVLEIVSTAVFRIYYYGIIIPAFLYVVTTTKGKAFVTLVRNSMVAKLVMMFFVYVFINSLINYQSQKIILNIGSILATFVLVFSLALFCSADRKLVMRLLGYASVIAGMIALFSIIIHLYKYGFVHRLQGTGFGRHEVLGGALMSYFGIMALYLHVHETRWCKWIYLMTFLIILSMIFLTGSRTPLVALFIATFIILLLHGRLHIFIGLMLLILAIVGLVWLIQGNDNILVQKILSAVERKDGFRLKGWEYTVDCIIRMPLFGYGISPKEEFEYTLMCHPHNILLSAAYYLGAIGFVMMLSIFVSIFLRSVRGLKENDRNAANPSCVHMQNIHKLILTMLMFSILIGMTDIGNFVRSVSKTTIVVWTPIAFAIGFYAMDKMKDVRSSFGKNK